jgi:hypothetical protein
MLAPILIALAPATLILLGRKLPIIRAGLPILWSGYVAMLLTVVITILPALTPPTNDGIKNVPYYTQITHYAAVAGLNPVLVASLVKQESQFNPMATSSVGAMGLAQLMPATAASLGVSNPFDPEQNLDGATRLLAHLIGKYDSWPLALAAYNAGEGRVDSCLCIPPIAETQTYVRQVLANYAAYSGVRLPYADGTTYSLFPNGYHGPWPHGRDYVASCGTRLVNPLPGGTITRKGTDRLRNTYLEITRGEMIVILLHGNYTPEVGETLYDGQFIGSEDTHGHSDRCHTHYSLIVSGLEIDPALAGME